VREVIGLHAPKVTPKGNFGMAHQGNSIDPSVVPKDFWERIRVDENGCWLWTGGVSGAGYGCFYSGGPEYTAHRVSLGLKIGRALTRNEMACHSCDVKLCINQSHLFLGDSKANTHDAIKKRRLNFQQPGFYENRKDRIGADHPGTSLTDTQVIEMWRLRSLGKTIREISEILDAPYGSVQQVLDGKRWTHVEIVPEIRAKVESMRRTKRPKHSR
jgi:hypothetical protein